ncbi:DinB family protein [Planococcus sp. 1R117A]|uniref:DinB family protein n=1 Tax=Planococcus sp. 1R117A TaxID=3447020 RepID=UPI003EDBCD24
MANEFLQKGMRGTSAHIDAAAVFKELDWQKAGDKPDKCPHSVWQLLWHMNYWQEFMLAYLKGEAPKNPEHAEETWPKEAMPASEEEWNDEVSKFTHGLQQAEQEAAKELSEEGFGGKRRTRADLLMVIINHNSYHAGQVVLVRRMIDAWPPSSGGDTW